MKPPRTARRHRATAAALAASLAVGAPGLAPAQGDPATLAGHSPALRSKSPVTLNFVSADIEAVTRAMGAMLDRQFLVDPRVKGNITLYSEQPVTVREAYLNYLAALRGLGYTVVEAGGLLKVLPEADAKLQTGSVSVGNTLNARGDTVVTQIFRLTHENVNSMVPVLRPLISPNNTINANPASNSLVITDYADNLQRIARIIAAMDQPNSSDIEVITLQHTVASDIAALVQRMADGPSAVPGAPPGVGGGGVTGATSVLADPRSNSLIVRAANPSRMGSIRAMVAKLDIPVTSAGAAGNIYVVYLKNADATKLATVLRAAYGAGGSGSAGGAAGGAGGGGLGGLSSTALTASNQPGGAAGGATSPQATTPVTPSAAPSTGGFVQADPSTNSLIITAPEPVYRQLRAVIDQLDSRRAQIFIESMIVEMDATKAAELGFQWQGLLGKSGDRYGLYGGTNFGSGGKNLVDITIAGATGSTDGISVGAGLNVGLIQRIAGTYTLGALARFLETNTGANILSTPNLVALDNEEAKFVNGQNVPFVTGQFTNTGTGAGAVSPFQTIERKDVGLTLRVRPQVGEGGKVRMTIFQENSSVAGSSSSSTSAANTGPTTNKSSIETTVEVENGQIMVLGGLLKDQFVNTHDKVPVLGDAPIVGGLFRSETRDRRKTNLMVFLRPVVMRNGEEAGLVTLDRYESIRALQKDSQPDPSRIMQINESPVLPPMRAPGEAASAPVPLSQPVPITEPVR